MKGLTFSLLLLLFIIKGFCQNINELEYFIDTDPGYGNGMQVTVSPGSDITQAINISLNSVAAGFHIIYVRAKDSNREWSMTQSSQFYTLITPTVITQSNVNQLEYFIDSDPGFGNGTQVPVSPGNAITQAININLNSIPAGFHIIYLRAKDSNGKWSMTQSSQFYTLASYVIAQSNVNLIEYFIDTDPGFGNGTQIPVSPGNAVTQAINISLNSITAGFHIIYVRTKDSNGEWSMTQSSQFYTLITPTVITQSNVDQIEYFIDTDPGFGNGTQVPVSPGNAITQAINISLNSVVAGFHIIYVRAKDSNGKWSMTQSSQFYTLITPTVITQSNVDQIEYFIDTDPGFGNGTQVAVSPGSDITQAINISLTGFVAGFHVMYVRAKDSNGKWSMTQSSPFYTLITPIVIAQSNVDQIEYFIDSDPGYGHGTQVVVSPGSDITQAINISLTGFVAGFHIMYVRAKDSNGKWSMTQSSPFYTLITPAVIIQSNVNLIEYFIDTDPGYGNGTQVAVSPGTNITQAININLNSVAVGFHIIYVRAKDSNGKWSLVQSSPFYTLNPTVTTQSNINLIETFIDTDPGFGNGSQVAVTPSPNVIQSFNVSLSGISPGSHRIYTRARDNNGKWSLTVNDTVKVLPSLPNFINQPSNIAVCTGSNATFSVVVSGAISMQWQENTGGGYINMINNSKYSGVTTGTLSISDADSTINGYLFRCLAVNFNNDTAFSVSATIGIVKYPVVYLGNDTDLCQAGNITLDAGNPGSVYNWSISAQNLQILTVDTSIVHTGTNNIYVTVTNSAGCSSADSITIILKNNSIAATSINSTSFSICPGFSTSLGLSGGFLGTGANWHWYSGSCGGVSEGNGNSQIVNPNLTTIYYARAEGICNTTLCASTTIYVNSNSSAADSIIVTNPAICAGSPTILNISGGFLGTGAYWYWYSGSCGGTFASSGASPVLIPATTTTYFLRAEGDCNTTTCVNKTITVNDLSVAAISISGTSSICSGTFTTLMVTGGGLGTNANWHWYGSTCGGLAVGTGISFTVAPSVTTYYYLRAEGFCNTTSCVSNAVTIFAYSIQADTIIPSSSIICSGSSVTMSVSGGSLGTYAGWHWYTGACGGTAEGSGTSVVQSPVQVTTYYVRAEGICNTTSCSSILITVNSYSSVPLSASASPASICTGSTSTLSFTGGNLGNASTWVWYSGSCGGSIEGTDTIIYASPANSTNYYVRAEGMCNTTNCANINVVVNSYSMPASTATATKDTICTGSIITLGITGGILGTPAAWNWYSGSCGGTSEGNGSTIIVIPTASTVYFVRAEGLCNTTPCIEIAVIVKDSSEAANSLISADTTCSGIPTTLSLTGGYLGLDAGWFWYSGICGGTFLGIGDAIVVNPVITTHYYVRAEGSLNTTACIDKIIVVSTPSNQPSIINAGLDTISSGHMDSLWAGNGSPGTGAAWYWYNGSCGGTIIGTGQKIVISPVITTDYFLRAEGLCNTTNCTEKIIFVMSGYSVSGTLMYDQSNYPLDSVWLYIRLNGTSVDSTMTDVNGSYLFAAAPKGVFTLAAKTKKQWGGVNSTDAVKVKRHFAGSEYLATSLRLHAADVNLSYGINTTDAVKITRRFVGSDTSFERGDWDFEKPAGGDTLDVSHTLNDTIIVDSSDVIQDFKGICVGDVNGSYYPGLKSQSKIFMNYNGVKKLFSGQLFEMPIKVSNNINVGAISLILNYPKNLADVLDIKLIVNNELQDVIYNVIGDEIRIGWFESDEPLRLQNNEPLIILRLKTTNNFHAGDNIMVKIANNSLCEFADEDGEPIDNVVLNTCSIEYTGTLNTGTESYETANDIIIFPDPANDYVNIYYSVAIDGLINISLYNILGEKVSDIVNTSQLKGSYNIKLNLVSLQSGIYTCKMKLEDNTIIIKRLVISR